MNEYLHGAFGGIVPDEAKQSARTRNAVVYVGTAPVHTVAGGAANKDRPVAVNSFSEAVKLFGYSDDWADYTLCEAIYTHLAREGVGPVVLINVLDTAKCSAAEETTAQLTPAGGRVTIAAADKILLDSVSITGKVKGTDYTIAYDYATKTITIRQTDAGSLGTEALSVKYTAIDPSKVADADVIGVSDGDGTNTGLYALKNVYQETGYIPSLLLCPGFSEVPEVHAAMIANSRKINGHWDMFVYSDIPIVKESAAMKISEAAQWKDENSYNNPNEKPHFPMALGTDKRKYHISVLGAVNFQKLMLEKDGIPYRSPSNTGCAVVENLYMGESATGLRFADDTINEKLNKNGIASVAFIGGQWVVWGAHTGDYAQDDAGNISASETNMMMMYYLSNDFQHRRAAEIDTPMTMNRLKQIVAEEQARLDALISTGALLYGKCLLNATEDNRSDMVKGDFSFRFSVTTTPLCKSLTALVNWTDKGFETYLVG